MSKQKETIFEQLVREHAEKKAKFEETLSTIQVATVLDVHRRTVDRYREIGILEGIEGQRGWRYTKEAVRACMTHLFKVGKK